MFPRLFIAPRPWPLFFLALLALLVITNARVKVHIGRTPHEPDLVLEQRDIVPPRAKAGWRGLSAFPATSQSGSTFQFSSASYNVGEGGGSVVINVTRSGDTSSPATVDYATSDGTASERSDYTTALGTLRFGAGDTSKSCLVLLIDDLSVESSETVNLTLSNPTGGAVLGSPASAVLTISDNDTVPTTLNPIDQTPFFVRQHYLDFLNRETDASGFAFWQNNIEQCGVDAQCRDVQRINTSASFFLSIEFQNTGYLVERIYKASYGDAGGNSTLGGAHQLAVPIIRFKELLGDTQEIGQGVVVLQPGWETVLENNKQAFAAEFVQRPRFITNFPLSMTPAQFVDKLNLNGGNPLSQSERDQLVNGLGAGTKTRAQVLRAVAEDQDLYNTEFNRAFVLMEYLGYLRRNPNDSPDGDYTGYEFWLTKLNQFGGNYINAEMVKAFLSSTEYRGRFAPTFVPTPTPTPSPTATPTPSPSPSPSMGAPPIDSTIATNVFDATAFLYSGNQPVQTGVAPGTIKPIQAAVVRGRVIDRNSAPLAGVTITILNHPEFGQTLTRVDGMFDMAVNGGGLLTVNYQKTGYLPLQRQMDVPWQDYRFLHDVCMIPLDNNATLIDITSAIPIQVAQGTSSNDTSGARRSTLLFKQGTTATMTPPNGPAQPLTTLHVRATEYTVGDLGPMAMPGDLPATSQYTYASEYSVDEALAANATAVTFSQPVIQYNENFLNFPVGTVVPSGAYDKTIGVWIPSANGLIVKIVSITAGVANLDIDGSGNPASDSALAALGINTAERQQLAMLYSVGQSLWRVPIIHFSGWDSNWGWGPPPDAIPPPPDPPPCDT